MRVTIDHHTVHKGLLFKTTYQQVSLHVQFSHGEKQIIRQRNLLQIKLADRRPADARVQDRDQQFELYVEDIVDGQVDTHLCANPAQAKIYEEKLLDMLGQMKAWLEENAETGNRTVVEL